MKTQVARLVIVRTGRHWVLAAVTLGVLAASSLAQTGKPNKLQCESLTTPLGMDVEHPRLSWQLRDPRDGARQTAYQIVVASKPSLLTSRNPDVWDSGRIESDDSYGIPYTGPELQANKRYFWRVLVWDRDNKQYPSSDASWWETGLLHQKNWQSKWIGYEESELRSVRESGALWIANPGVGDFVPTTSPRHDFRLRVDVAKPVRRAVLYATGQDTTAA
jgi:alpha-L-rhamnosidase